MGDMWLSCLQEREQPCKEVTATWPWDSLPRRVSMRSKSHSRQDRASAFLLTGSANRKIPKAPNLASAAWRNISLDKTRLAMFSPRWSLSPSNARSKTIEHLYSSKEQSNPMTGATISHYRQLQRLASALSLP